MFDDALMAVLSVLTKIIYLQFCFAFLMSKDRKFLMFKFTYTNAHLLKSS